MRRGSVLFGLVLMAAGAVFLAGSLGWVDDAWAVIGDWWPVAIVGAGALELWPPARNVANGVLLAVVGGVLLLFTADALEPSRLAVLWPIGLIAMGVWIVAGRPRGRRAENATDVDLIAVFGGREARIANRPFEGGSAVAVFGGVELDLTEADLVDGATLETIAVFGGVEIAVPAGWRIKMSGPAIFAGFEDGTRGPVEPDAPELLIRGLAVFGGVEVKDRSPARSRPFQPRPSAS